jgi:septal ring factor EnvC (AmiA/AmiB activator)
MIDPYWFQKKWGFAEPVPSDDIYKKLQELEDRIKVLEEENVETTNTLYEVMNSIDAVDARIDILTLENWKNKDV